MPTRNRRRFVGQSIWYFLRQDYPNKELIVVDDGEDSIADLIPDDVRIRYHRLDGPISVGAKRNVGADISRGQLIAHWDDDDWIAPHRLSIQVKELLQSGADVCGTQELLHYSVESGEAWSYCYGSGQRPWLAGGTLMYRRSAWSRNHFPETNVGEDTQFVWQQDAERVLSLPDTSFYVALIHCGNTSAKRLADPHWQRRSLDDVTRLLSLDRDFYVSLRNGNQAIGARRAVSEGITVASSFAVYDGYGSMAEFLVLGMRRAGASVNVVPLYLDLQGMSDEFKQILDRSRAEANAPVIYFSWPRPELERFRNAEDLFIYTMWESDRLPSGWADRLNKMRAVLVPTRFVADVCRNSGVKVPVEIVPQGIDPNVYHYQERQPREHLTTLVVGTVIARKHVREAIDAWKLAFPDRPDARLIIKSRFKYGNYSPDDARIEFVDTNETTRGIPHWYQQADVLVAVGNEGFGLPLVEGMATGLPVIALNSEGQSDICEGAGKERLLPVAPERWEECNEGEFGRCGVRGVPSVTEIAARLRWVDEHRDEAREMGRAASEWVLKNRNVWKMGKSALDVVERYVEPSRPLRRVPAFWVPSWQTACGISEYTGHLLENLSNVKVAPQMPDLRGVRVLHVQHEFALFDDAVLTSCIQRARVNRVPTVITQHTVTAEMAAWEREADVLTTLTKAGFEKLRARWPHKRVEYLPHGCPTWFPPRKQKPGRVIGAFGFLEPHKGFWRLLDVLRALPDTEVLLVSHSKYPENVERWTQDSAGLPVRHYKEFLPVEEAARLLAAEADILVYWYDEIANSSASGAVRVGLATGVPVLTSPTGWFADLKEVTFQPTDLSEGIKQLLDDAELRHRLTSAAHNYCNEHSWPRTAARHLAIWRSLESQN